jgi:molecular chaperone HtpG
VKAATDHDYTVLWMDSPLDSHFISFLEHKNEHLKFARVDADSIEKLIDKGETVSSSLSKDQESALSGWIEKLIDKKKFEIAFETLSQSEAPMIITRDEWTRRASDLKQLTGQSWFDGIEEHFKLIVNTNHSIVSKILLDPNPDDQNKMLRQVIDLAMLSQNMLHGEALAEFVNRSVGMMK